MNEHSTITDQSDTYVIIIIQSFTTINEDWSVINWLIIDRW